MSIVAMPKTFPVTCHTDFVGPASTFVAIDGYCDNGIKYIPLAVKKGARAIIIDKKVCLKEIQIFLSDNNISVVRVENTRQALANLSAQAADFPAKQLKIIGITGTKGKTTTAFLLEHCLRFAGYKTGLISSAGNSVCGIMFPPSLTTPQPDYLHQFLKVCVENHVEYVVMEVAAQALTLYRVTGIVFDGVIFTNFSHEHLEFYATLDDYYAAKCNIFDQVNYNAPVLINNDDQKVFAIQEKIAHLNPQGYGFLTNQYAYKGTYIDQSSQMVSLRVQHDTINLPIQCSSLFGQYNAYNVLAAISMMHALKIPSFLFAEALHKFPGVPGRLQHIVLANGARGVIDYAHNPSSFEAVLSTLRQLTDNLIVIFGAGGGRDKFKRPVMGAIASIHADHIILTTDNPRFEDPFDIIYDIKQGIAEKDLHKIVINVDREMAIRQAYSFSQLGSIIAILGKGPDEYQIVQGIKTFFSEKNILKQLQ